jgi:putative heme-binding domain-containing protein
MRFVLCLTVYLAVCLAQANHQAHAVKNPMADKPEAIDAGRAGFAQACAACHGANAEGGRGPNLARSNRVRQLTDDELFNVIRRGVPGTAMPAFPLPDNTIWQIATFLRSLSTPAFLVAVAGDVRAGEEVYRQAKCASCHMIYGRGGFLGPDLTDIAASRTVKQLRESILNPSGRPIDGFTGVTLTLDDRTHVEGVAKNYSDYSIDVLDANGSLHLLSMSQVKEMKLARKSLMPDSYAQTLSQEDIQNLIAFLSHQAVRPDARPDQKMSNREEH